MTRFKFSRDRGAVLIHVAVAMLGLLAFSALVVDYGVFWVSRRQAQNAADAGALAGAMGLAFDSPTDFSDTGPAKLAAQAAATSNLVFGGAPSVDITTDITFPACPDDGTDTCVKVDVYRTVARSNPLPSFFARLVGITTQDVQATATAKVVKGNSTTCLKPWAVADKWDEFGGSEPDWNPGPDPDWNADSTYDKYSDGKGQKPPQEDDLYVPPTICPASDTTCVASSGTSYRLFETNGTPIDYGRQLTLKNGQAKDGISSGWFMAIRLNDSKGGQDYEDNIKGCVGVSYSIGDTIAIDTQTEQGNKVGKTRQGTSTDKDSLISQDPDAYWDDDYFGTVNGVNVGAVISPIYAPNQSPRIVAIPIFSPAEYLSADPEGLSDITISNILGFFIEDMEKQDKGVNGRLVTFPGDFDSGASTVDENSAFIFQIILIR